MMVVPSSMRWPQPRSPDELRAFYSIALNSEQFDATRLDQTEESRSSRAPTWSTSGSIRAHSSSTSVFSGQARTGSSGTSVSDSKTIVALAPGVRYEETTGLLRLQEELPPPKIEPDIQRASPAPEQLIANGSDQSEHSHVKPVKCKRWWRDRHLARHEGNIQDAGDDQATAIPTEPVPEEKFWLDTLQEHPYYNLEEDTKLGRVGTWRVRRRRRDLRSSHSTTKKEIDVDDDADLADNDLLEKSVSESDEETIHVVDDVVGDAASLMGSFESRLKRRRSETIGLDDLSRTLLLELGANQSLALPIESDCFGKQPSPSSSAGTLEFFPTDLDDMAEDFGARTHKQIRRPQNRELTSYYCLFCFERFDHQKDWEKHEYSHLKKQKDWICMPWGATEKLANGDTICVFCGLVDPSSSHGSCHNEESCRQKSVSQRTYSCKTDFENHLREFHDQHTLTERMEKWSFAVEDEDWYWQCGFCERSLVGWEDRSRHIGRHFKEGLSIISWDPAVPFFPIDRSTGIAASWSSQDEMDRKRSHTVQLQQSGLIERASICCRHCPIKFDNEGDTGRHEKLCHLPRDVWRCPTKNDARTATHLQTGPLAAFLFPNAPSSSASTSDVCPYCWEYSEDIFYELDEDINECSADWEIRIEHLKSEHKFDKCPTSLLFFRPDQFLLHLVGYHNLKLSNWTKEIMDSCKRKEICFPS